MSNSTEAEERRTDIALFRYTLILPVLREPSARARQQMRRNLAAVVYDLPHSNRQRISLATLRRWEGRYRAGGFEALKPQPRSDRGQPRAGLRQDAALPDPEGGGLQRSRRCDRRHCAGQEPLYA